MNPMSRANNAITSQRDQDHAAANRPADRFLPVLPILLEFNKSAVHRSL
jgi:hypothetical protein